MRLRDNANEAVVREIAGLADLDRDALIAQWEGLYGTQPPKGVSQVLLRKVLAHEIQCRAFGGLKTATRRALKATLQPGAAPAVPQPTTPGARLVPEWNCRTYEVEVIEGGFCWQGETYRSLSRIAREITGSNWSGPRFFGLAGKR